MMDILFLGTGASVPSRNRTLPAIAIRKASDVILFDCGEGTQRQLMISPFSFMRIAGIFITHMHGDHVLGLPGLLQTMGLSGRKDPLIVCGPEGFRHGIESVLSVCEGEIPYPLEIKELIPGDFVRIKDMEISAYAVEHNTSAIGFVLKEDDQPGKFDKAKAQSYGIKPGPDYSRLQDGETVNGITLDMVSGPIRSGTKIVYSGDTIPCDTTIEAAKDADLLIHESTYQGADKELAAAHWHSTSEQAAEIAVKAGCRSLILTHISNRYEDRDVLLNEARSVFENSFMADDMRMFKLVNQRLDQLQ